MGRSGEGGVGGGRYMLFKQMKYLIKMQETMSFQSSHFIGFIIPEGILPRNLHDYSAWQDILKKCIQIIIISFVANEPRDIDNEKDGFRLDTYC